ncbi:ABC-F family ATP-binding cassette domain-containing protein [Capnocytophaga leadbetteri]|uniref:ABC-F family ATP-binding cassette domain-containing protein n=1 Tax=Capnocytophaga leadbetteri TaxID=327575 RepID=UPI0028D41066|nr:ABC-F family ATP-binding cassette domain-containing protein [Capnocytophaga leadbetteri]
MLNVHNLSVSFQGEYLFEEVAFMLNAGDRVGLIGKNGAGKSTMLKLLSRELKPDSGTIAADKDVRIGFLKQDIDFVKGRTILEEAYQAFGEIKTLEQKLDDIHHQIETRTDYESESYHNLLDMLSDYTHRFDLIGGYQYQGETEKVLLGLGFQRSDFDKLTDSFSGGWRMRIELAKLLLQNNDILLLDEPTNHLDIESIIWLEQFLTTYSGAVVIVSHDKMFLDNVTNRTIEISVGKIYDYPKPYSKFLELRQEIREQQLASQKNQEKKIQQTEKLIEKFRAKASKASMAQSLIKKLDKIDRIEVDEEDNAVMNVRFPVSVTPGKVVIEIEDVSKSYGEKEVLSHVSLLVERGSKIAFVGQNGQGKTTLAKMIIGETDYQGTIKLGHNVQLGYFAQNQADYLDGELTVLDTMYHAADDTNRMKIRDILGSFLFRGDEVDKKVKVLSGGERNRLALAKMLLSDFNVLVMDEPTNHLDIKSKNVLKKALQQFEGTLIIVSHDRDFLQGLTDKVYEFKNKNIKEYLGDIDFYLEQRAVANFREMEQQKETLSAPTKATTSAEKLSFEQQKQQKAAQNKLNKIENQIAALEEELKQMDIKMGQGVQSNDYYKEYEQKKRMLEELMTEWENLMS